MGTFLLALVIVLLLIAGMSIGVIMGRKPISGTCGGLNNMGGNTSCDICGGNPQKCEESSTSATANTSDLSYDATKD
ncbi:(Na+)-NQR maturation NqrM [Marinobacteraceae bacterium S3BR75-40.1]